MKIERDHPVIDELLNGKDEIVYNLVALIREQNGARLYSDGRSYLTAQSNADFPMWIYVNARADERTETELFSVLSEAMEGNARLSVNAQEGFAEKTLSLFAKRRGLKLMKRNPLIAYSIGNVREIPPAGGMIVSEEKYEKKIATLFRQGSVDDWDEDMTDEEAMGFAKANVNTGNLYLWVDGEVVSMARVVRYGGKFARLTAVVTERAARGKGYAKMLVGELSKRILAEGLTPVLYARSENPSSNRCYKNIGFEKAGEICEFTIKE